MTLLEHQSGALRQLRIGYHQKICTNLLGYRNGAISVADRNNAASTEFAERMARQMSSTLCGSPPAGQTLGTLFTQFTSEFLDDAFLLINHLRPGRWHFSVSQSGIGIASYAQYCHLHELTQILDGNPELKAALGGDYLVVPDIIVAREPIADEDINKEGLVIAQNDDVAGLTPLREANTLEYGTQEILHASISCKWSMRSDRAQNTRTEALNLIRNRKGRTPHIVAVTLEPLPSRIASLALGTGDLDCVYHAALYELQAAVDANKGRWPDSHELLNTLIGGKRLRDISDLVLDLAG